MVESVTSMQALDFADELKNINTPTLVLSGGADSLLHTNLDDYRRLPNACLQVFFRAAHEIGIHQTKGVAEHCPPVCATWSAECANLASKESPKQKSINSGQNEGPGITLFNLREPFQGSVGNSSPADNHKEPLR